MTAAGSDDPGGSGGVTGPQSSAVPALAAGKAAWRRWARGLPSVGPEVERAVAGHLRRFLDDVDGPVCGYLALPDEVGIAAVIEADHRRWVLPRVDDSGTLCLHVDDGRRRRGAFGLDEPSPECEVVDPGELAAVLVPGRVFDRHGFRLGRGGGHYDRLLPRLAPGIPAVGVTWSDRLVDAVPVEPHDRPMSHLVTERGVIRPDP